MIHVVRRSKAPGEHLMKVLPEPGMLVRTNVGLSVDEEYGILPPGSLCFVVSVDEFTDNRKPTPRRVCLTCILDSGRLAVISANLSVVLTLKTVASWFDDAFEGMPDVIDGDA